MPGKEVLGAEQPLDRHWPLFSVSTSSRASVTIPGDSSPRVFVPRSMGEKTHIQTDNAGDFFKFPNSIALLSLD